MERKTREKRELRPAGEKKPEVNRKLIAWAFILTGLVSLGMWWRGKDREAEAGAARWWEGWIKPVEINFEVARRSIDVTPAVDTVKAERDKLVGEMQERVATASGTYSVYVYELKGRQGWGFGEQEKMPGASILKLPALVAGVRKVEDGSWKLEEEFTLTEADRSPGSGPLQFEPAGTKVSVARMLAVLGKNSDNTAWLMLNRLVGVQAIEEVMTKAGMTSSEYRAGGGEITAADVGRLLVKIYDQEVVGVRGKQLVREDLSESIYEDRIPAGIPEGEARVVHKVGTLPDVWGDAGVVEPTGGDPFVLVILNKGVIRSEATALVPWLAGRVWEYESGRQ